MEVLFLESGQEAPEVLDVLLQLRLQYNRESLAQQIFKQMQAGYRVAYVQSDEGVLAAAGFVVGEKLAWGKHIYIDDLVTNSSCRSKGVGRFLIDWFKRYALELGCEQLHLDSGVQRFGAHRFYLGERFNIASHHFSISDIQINREKG